MKKKKKQSKRQPKGNLDCYGIDVLNGKGKISVAYQPISVLDYPETPMHSLGDLGKW